MAQRTIAEAKALLDDQSAAINPQAWANLQAEVTDVERQVRQSALGYIQVIYDRAAHTTLVNGQGACEVRDAARVLTADLKAGRISAAEGAKRWNELRAQSRRLSAANERLAQDAEHIGVIEDDPVGFYDSTIHEKNPQLRPLFSF